jgi:hypothetical protein
MFVGKLNAKILTKKKNKHKNVSVLRKFKYTKVRQDRKELMVEENAFHFIAHQSASYGRYQCFR